MADQVSNYKCPNCGGPLRFDPASQKLKCEYCDSLFTQKEVEEFYRPSEEAAAAEGTDQKWETETGEWTAEEAAHMRAYSCPSCGASLIADENTAVTVCPYCSNPTVVAGQFVTKKPLLPKAFSSRNHIEEIKGVYVPFWLYNGVMECRMDFHAENVRQFSHGDDIVTETDHFKLVRTGTVTFSGVPADASSKMPDEYMDAIEPFDYSKLKDFDTMYMAGYMADSYDVDAEQDRARSESRMKASAVRGLSPGLAAFHQMERQYLSVCGKRAVRQDRRGSSV